MCTFAVASARRYRVRSACVGLTVHHRQVAKRSEATGYVIQPNSSKHVPPVDGTGYGVDIYIRPTSPSSCQTAEAPNEGMKNKVSDVQHGGDKNRRK